MISYEKLKKLVSCGKPLPIPIIRELLNHTENRELAKEYAAHTGFWPTEEIWDSPFAVDIFEVMIENGQWLSHDDLFKIIKLPQGKKLIKKYISSGNVSLGFNTELALFDLNDEDLIEYYVSKGPMLDAGVENRMLYMPNARKLAQIHDRFGVWSGENRDLAVNMGYLSPRKEGGFADV